MDEETKLILPVDADPPKTRKIPWPLADWLQIEPVDDPQTFGSTGILLPEDSDLERAKRRRAEMQGTREPQAVREGKMRHARIIKIGPECKRAKGLEGQLIRFVEGVAAFYLNGEEVVMIRDEQLFCRIEEWADEPPRVLQ